MNNCEQGQRRWPTTPSFHDLLLLEQKTELVHNVQEEKQHSHVNKSTETRATSDPHQHWKVPVKWIQTRAKNNKKKLQVRSRFEALRTDDEEFPITDEYDDPGLPGTVAKKQHQGGMQKQTCKHRSATTRINARDEGREVDLCPLERGKMLGSTEGARGMMAIRSDEYTRSGRVRRIDIKSRYRKQSKKMRFQLMPVHSYHKPADIGARL